jgi:hypothetical protein
MMESISAGLVVLESLKLMAFENSKTLLKLIFQLTENQACEHFYVKKSKVKQWTHQTVIGLNPSVTILLQHNSPG